MKKYAVFIVSFAFLYILGQLLTGWLLTAVYTPDIQPKNKMLSQEVEFGQTASIPLITTLLSATLAYVMSQKLFKSAKK